MALSSLGNQTASCESLHDWLMSLAMDLAALNCVTCGGENGINGSHFPVLNEDVAFACRFAVTRPSTLPPYRSASGTGYAVKIYSKWREIQLAISSVQFQSFLRYIELNISKLFLNIYNCAYKTPFCKSSHI